MPITFVSSRSLWSTFDSHLYSGQEIPVKHGHLGRASFPPPSYSSSRHCMSFPPHSSCFMSHCTFSPLHTQFCPRTSVFCPSSSQGRSLLPFSMTQLLMCLCSAVWTFPTHPLPPFCRIGGMVGLPWPSGTHALCPITQPLYHLFHWPQLSYFKYACKCKSTGYCRISNRLFSNHSFLCIFFLPNAPLHFCTFLNM